MIRRPPKSTRTDTLFPYTTLVRSVGEPCNILRLVGLQAADNRPAGVEISQALGLAQHLLHLVFTESSATGCMSDPDARIVHRLGNGQQRSEERRVGKECVSTFRLRWSAYQ